MLNTGVERHNHQGTLRQKAVSTGPENMSTQTDLRITAASRNSGKIADRAEDADTARQLTAKRMRIGFYGLFGQQNWGNEATLQAMISNTRRYVPDVELRCVCTGPDDTAQRYNI